MLLRLIQEQILNKKKEEFIKINFFKKNYEII